MSNSTHNQHIIQSTKWNSFYIERERREKSAQSMPRSTPLRPLQSNHSISFSLIGNGLSVFRSDISVFHFHFRAALSFSASIFFILSVYIYSFVLLLLVFLPCYYDVRSGFFALCRLVQRQTFSRIMYVGRILSCSCSSSSSVLLLCLCDFVMRFVMFVYTVLCLYAVSLSMIHSMRSFLSFFDFGGCCCAVLCCV